MRVQFNVSMLMVVMSFAALITFRYQEHQQLTRDYLHSFAHSQLGGNVRLLSKVRYRDTQGRLRNVHVFVPASSSFKNWVHPVVVVTDYRGLPIAWGRIAGGRYFSKLKVDREQQILINAQVSTQPGMTTLRYAIDIDKRAVSGVSPAYRGSGSRMITVIRGGTLSPGNVYQQYQNLGDRRNGEPVGRWGNR